MMPAVAYIALGANLASPIAMIEAAIFQLTQLPQTALLKRSSLYKTKPLGPSNQPDFINAVIAIATEMPPLQLLASLKTLECDLGRAPGGERWGPRMIDLDILLYGDAVMESDKLTLPHPGIYHREFVLYPLAEIAPDLILPTGQLVVQLKMSCDPRGIEKCSL